MKWIYNMIIRTQNFTLKANISSMKKFLLIAFYFILSVNFMLFDGLIFNLHADSWNFVIMDDCVTGFAWNGAGTSSTQTVHGVNLETGEIETYTIIGNPRVIYKDESILHTDWGAFYKKQGKEYGEFIENLGNNKLSDILR